jgi:hypothetical protein
MSSASRLSQLDARISSIEKSRGCFIERIPFQGVARRLPFITDFKFVPADPDPLALSKYQLGAGHEDEKKPSEVMRVSDEQACATIPDAWNLAISRPGLIKGDAPRIERMSERDPFRFSAKRWKA